MGMLRPVWLPLSICLVLIATLSGCPGPGPDPNPNPNPNPDPTDYTLESSGPIPFRGGESLDIKLSDGTRLWTPALAAQGTLTQVTIDHVAKVADLSAEDLEVIGLQRVVSFDSFDPREAGVDSAAITPTLILPSYEFTAVDRDTLAVMRIADLYIDGVAMPAHVSSLPVTFTVDGDIMVTDTFFPDSIFSDLAYENAKSDSALAKRYPIHPREVRYVVTSFRGSYNWRNEPALTRFYPNTASTDRRIQWHDLTSDQQEEEEDKCVQNLLILVHGHNEEEKLGNASSTAPAPWHYGYKRDVWTLFYDYLLQDAPDLLECTAVYEFVYPTYKPIFSPHDPGQRLDEHFARAVNDLAAARLAQESETRIFIVAHSMGGLVARAGIQLFKAPTHQAFEKLVTWGTPHMGSPLVSLRYVLGAPGGIYRAGPDGVVTFPLDNIDNTLFALRRAIDNVQVDAPGTRDLRWANSHTTTPHNLALDQLFSFDVSAASDPNLWNRYDLHTGTEVYSSNLRQLNTQDVYRLSNKYHALYGVTSKRARIEFPLFRWFRPTVVGGDTAIGALVMPWLVQNSEAAYDGNVRGDSDGAVPVASMGAAGTAGIRRDIGDIDHEEYFGAPQPHGQFQATGLAQTMARQTLYALDMPDCPPDQPAGQRTFNLARADEQVLTNYRGSGIDITLQRSATMDVTVNYSGQNEPTIRQDSWDPPMLWRVVVQDYDNPLTVSGSFGVSVSTTEFDLVSGSGTSRYMLKKTEFENATTGTVQVPVSRNTQWSQTGSYNTVFTVPPQPVVDSNFPSTLRLTYGIGRMRLVWEVTDYNLQGEVVNGPYNFVDTLYSLPGVINVDYLLWIDQLI